MVLTKFVQWFTFSGHEFRDVFDKCGCSIQMATRRVLVNFEHNVVKFDVNSESDLLNSFTGSFLLSFTSTLQGPTALPKKITNTQLTKL